MANIFIETLHRSATKCLIGRRVGVVVLAVLGTLLTGCGTSSHNSPRPQAIAVSHAAHIYWANGSNIGRANLDGTGVNQSFIAGANADTVVVKNNHLYWENHNGQGDLIGRANLDGSGVNQGFVPGSLIYGGLAVNNNYIYWSGGTILSRANIDGTGVNQSFITGLSSLGAIAVGGNYIYWTSSSGINRASLDGAGVNLDFINAAYTSAVVIGNNYIYWASGDSIGRANLDGTGANKSFITSISSISDIAVDTSA